jgi:NitT/TauT family transport system substrate-binding protein
VRKIVFVLIAALLVVGVLAGCGSTATTETTTATTANAATTGTTAATAPSTASTTATTAAADADYVVQLGYYGCDHMIAAAVARDAGIWTQLGLKVNAVGGGNVPEAMAAGKMDVGYIGTEGLVRAKTKGSPIFVAANNHLGGSYYIVGASKYNSAAELVGKKFGVAADADTTDSYWVRIAAAAGIPADPKKYEAVSIGGSDAVLAMKNGQLDGFVDCDPWGSAAVVDGCGKILEAVSKLPTTGDWGNCCCFSMNDKFASEHPELAKKMIKAHSLAIEYIYENPLKAADIFAKEKGVDVEVALRTIWAKTVGDGRTLTWKVEPQRFTDEFNYVKSVTDIEVPVQSEWLKTTLLDQAGCDDFDAFIKDKIDPKFPLNMTFEDWKKAAGA